MNTSYLVLFALFFAGVFYILLMVIVRNELVYRMRIRRIDEIHEFIVNATDTQLFDARAYKDFRDGPTYDQMVWDLRKWTYRQFYPDKP